MYTSPEGLNYFKKPQQYLIQSAADIFSMGCVLYELLTDLRAFVRPADGYAGELTFDELHKLVLWRQAQWVSSFSATGIVWASSSPPTVCVQQQALTLNFLLLCLVHAALYPDAQSHNCAQLHDNESAC